MDENQKKIFKDALRAEISPLLIGLRNDIKESNTHLEQVFSEIAKKSTVELFFNPDVMAKMKPKDGITPEKGVHYFTEQEKEEFLKAITPIKGIHYFTEQEVVEFKIAVTPVKGIDYRDGIDGHTPIKGIDYLTSEELEGIKLMVTPIKGVHYKDGDPGKPGVNGTEISAEEIRDRLESLRGSARLSISAITGLQEILNSLSVEDKNGNGSTPIGVSGVSKLTDLSDIKLSTLTNGDVLTWSSTLNAWKNAASSGGSVNLIISENLNTLASQSGNNVVLTLAHTPTSLALYRNGARLTPTTEYSLSTNQATVYNAIIGDSFLGDYLY